MVSTVHAHIQMSPPTLVYPPHAHSHAPPTKGPPTVEPCPALPLPVKSSWSKADSSGGPNRLLDSGSSEASGLSAQLETATGAGPSLAPEAFPVFQLTQPASPTQRSLHHHAKTRL